MINKISNIMIQSLTSCSHKYFGHGKKAWFIKHVNDPYVKKANQLNYRSRASFKLLQILKKHPMILKKDQKPQKNIKIDLQKLKLAEDESLITKILDLGCAPGSWSQVMKQYLPKSQIASVDLLEMKPLPGIDFYQINARNRNLHKKLHEKYGRFELIISDMAPNFNGDTASTHFQLLQLNALCVRLCFELGSPFCSLVMKSLHGEKQKNMFNLLTHVFDNVYREKPQSSRADSVEFFYVCQKMKEIKEEEKAKLGELFIQISQNSEKLDKFKSKKQTTEEINNILNNK